MHDIADNTLEKKLFNSFPYVQFVIDVTEPADLRLAAFNQMAGALYGITAAPLALCPIRDVLPEHVAEFITIAAIECATRRQVTITAPENFPGLTDTSQSFTLSPILGAGGDVTHVTVTELPYADTALILQKQRDNARMLMNSALDASPMGLFVSDDTRAILRVNDAFLTEFGFAREAIVGRDFTTLFADKDRPDVTAAHAGFLAGRSETKGEWQLATGSGGEAEVIVTTAPLYSGNDRPLAVHSLVDISRHKNLEEKLRIAKAEADHANQAKSAFLAGMSHELRTPLNAILGFSELIKNEIFGPLGHAKYHEYMNDVHFAAHHLLELINDVLDMSKIEAGKFELHEQTVDMFNLLDSVKRVMADRASAYKTHINTKTDDAVMHITGDQRVLRQMLFNLVSNAVKFSRPNTVINVRAAADKANGDILLTVQDQGRGIAPEEIERLFEPFRQGADGVSEGSGTGLGLPLTRAMAELHGGTLTIDSEPGQGTVATIRLPHARVLTPSLPPRLAKRAA